MDVVNREGGIVVKYAVPVILGDEAKAARPGGLNSHWREKLLNMD